MKSCLANPPPDCRDESLVTGATDHGTDRATAVFVGPSLHGVDGLPVGNEWSFHPPARSGDLIAAAKRGASRIVLIDGVFIESLPPTPGEILRLLRNGIDVIGAASLGALRAVELEPFGMIGIGWVYRQFRSARLFADDEVMVVYDAQANRPLSEALVNLRYALMRCGKWLPAGCPRRILARIGDLYFPERTRHRIAQAVTAEAGPAIAERFMRAYPGLNIKTADALDAMAMRSAVFSKRECTRPAVGWCA